MQGSKSTGSLIRNTTLTKQYRFYCHQVRIRLAQQVQQVIEVDCMHECDHVMERLGKGPFAASLCVVLNAVYGEEVFQVP
jgi:hypothetical protein